MRPHFKIVTLEYWHNQYSHLISDISDDLTIPSSSQHTICYIC